MIVIIYLLKTLLCSAVFYSYYLMVLRDKAFHRYNRYYLLSTPVLSVLLPLLKLPVDFNFVGRSEQWAKTLRAINVGGWEEEFIVTPRHSFSTSLLESQETWYLFYFLGCFAVLYPLIRSFGAISSLAKKYRPEFLGSLRFYNTTEPGTPFSFFRTIFWNREISLESAEGKHILRHEMFHISQRHSFDLVYLELMKSLFWFNPVFYLTRNEMQTIHEFLADEHASSQSDRYAYAELLVVQAIENKRSDLYHHFFNTEIKRRIAMITKTQMKRYNYFGRAMALPLAFVIFCAFSLNFHKQNAVTSTAQQRDTMPMSQLLKIDFASVKEFSINDQTVLLTLKDKKSILVKKKVFDEYMAIKSSEKKDQQPRGSVVKDGKKTFVKTEIEAGFPGGASAWMRFLNESFKYPQEAQDKEISGKVVVQFIVDVDGDVSEIKALSGPLVGGLREEAVRVISISGKWLPGIQNGQKVRSYKKQPITFMLEAE